MFTAALCLNCSDDVHGGICISIFAAIHRLPNGVQNKEKIIGLDDLAEPVSLVQDFELVPLHLIQFEQRLIIGESTPRAIAPLPRLLLGPNEGRRLIGMSQQKELARIKAQRIEAPVPAQRIDGVAAEFEVA